MLQMLIYTPHITLALEVEAGPMEKMICTSALERAGESVFVYPIINPMQR